MNYNLQRIKQDLEIKENLTNNEQKKEYLRAKIRDLELKKY